MNEVKEQLYNPLKNLIFGGRLSGDNLVYNGTRRGHYAGTEYLAWMYKSKKPTYKQSARIVLNTEQSTVPAWEASLARTEKEINVSKDKQATRRWWNDFGNVALLRGKVKREMLSVTIHCSAICWDVTPIVSGLPSLTGDCLLLILCM